jgi:hypothetical protein
MVLGVASDPPNYSSRSNNTRSAVLSGEAQRTVAFIVIGDVPELPSGDIPVTCITSVSVPVKPGFAL